MRAILTGIDRHVPFGSSGSIALFTKDVYQYLKNPGIRDAIETGVREAMSLTPAVVVAHSLGSVVAYNLLRREGANNGWNVPLLVTVGCPFGGNRHPQMARAKQTSRVRRPMVQRDG